MRLGTIGGLEELPVRRWPERLNRARLKQAGLVRVHRLLRSVSPETSRASGSASHFSVGLSTLTRPTLPQTRRPSPLRHPASWRRAEKSSPVECCNCADRFAIEPNSVGRNRSGELLPTATCAECSSKLHVVVRAVQSGRRPFSNHSCSILLRQLR